MAQHENREGRTRLPGTRSIIPILLAASWFTSPSRANDAPVQEMLVPGGRAAVARFLGSADERPDRLAASANLVLLDGISRRNDWREVGARSDLSLYASIAGELYRTTHLRGLTLEGDAGRRRFEELCGAAGYVVRSSGGATSLDPEPGDEAAVRRRVFQALGWNLGAIALRLDAKASVALRIAGETAAPLIPLDEWSALARTPIGPDDALARLARDQQAGLYAIAWNALDAESRAAFALDDRRGLYERATAFFRYGTALRVRQGRIVAPGGAAGERAWAGLLETPLDRPAAFALRLLDDPAAAYLWYALTVAPPPVATVLSGGPDVDDGATLRRVLEATRRLDRWAFFDLARGGDPLLPALLRALPVDPATYALALPGGTATWSAALRGTSLPKKPLSIESAVTGSAADTVRFVLELLDDTVKTGPVEHSLIPRCLRALEIFARRPVLATPGNVAFVARSFERYPGALDALDQLPVADPSLVGAYLLEVARLDEYRAGTGVFIGFATFEGGVELLRQLARAGRVPANDVDRLFARWIALHTSARSPEDNAPGALAWLDELARVLPPAPGDAPGRGPAERSLLAAIAPESDPQCFTYQGLDYCGQRARTRAAAAVDDLARQNVASLDQLLAIRADLEELRTAADPQPVVERAVAHVTALPRVDVPDASGARAWFEPTGRDDLLDGLRALATVKLSRRAKRVDALAPRLAQELRPFFVAPAYLPALAESVRLLGDDPSLVRRHTVVRRLDTVVRQQDGGDTPWQRAVLVPAADGRMARIAGHVAGAAAPLGTFQYGVPPGQSAKRRYGTELARTWFGAVAAARWERVSAATLEAASLLERAGTNLLAAALAEPAGGPHRAFAEARLAPARLAAEPAPAGPAERILLALAAAEGDAAGPANPALLAAEDRTALDRLAAQGTPPGTLLEPLFEGRVEAIAYERVATETGVSALHDRERLDLRLAIALWLARHHLPGQLGEDLFARIVAELPGRLELAAPRDWNSFSAWLATVDDTFFDERMRQCFALQLYSVR